MQSGCEACWDTNVISKWRAAGLGCEMLFQAPRFRAWTCKLGIPAHGAGCEMCCASAS